MAAIPSSYNPNLGHHSRLGAITQESAKHSKNSDLMARLEEWDRNTKYIDGSIAIQRMLGCDYQGEKFGNREECAENKLLFTLDLQDLNIDSLPPEIGQISNLKVILLKGSHVKSVPPEIGQLGQLWSLDLTDTLIDSLPPELFQLPATCKVSLINCPLSEETIHAIQSARASNTGPEFLLKPFDQDDCFMATHPRLMSEIKKLPASEIENVFHRSPKDSEIHRAALLGLQYKKC